jgi:hypothetical protein
MKNMRWFFILLFLASIQLNTTFVFGAETINKKTTESKLLVKILTESEIVLLNDTETNHIIRIFKLPYVENNHETELLCGYDVYVGVCERGEGTEGNVFYIGKVGEIKHIQCGKSFLDGTKDVTNIVLETADYSDQYYHYYPKIKVQKNTIKLNITSDAISITKN